MRGKVRRQVPRKALEDPAPRPPEEFGPTTLRSRDRVSAYLKLFLVPDVKPRLGAYPQWEILFNPPVWAGPAMFQFPCSMVTSSSKIPG